MFIKVCNHILHLCVSETLFVKEVFLNEPPKMATPQEKAQWVAWFIQIKSDAANVYLDLLTEYVAPQLNDLQPTIIFQQDGAPPHWGLHVRGFLNGNISRPVNWKEWANSLATTFTRYHYPGLLSMGLC